MGVYLVIAMRYFIIDHQHKGQPIAEALNLGGWVYNRRHPDIALIDHNINRLRYTDERLIIANYKAVGATIISYPHGATGAWWMDSDLYSKTDGWAFANLVIGEGHKHVSSIIQSKTPHHVIGWSYCPIKQFVAKSQVKRILFAPIHSSIRSHMLRSEAKDTNKRVFEALVKIKDSYTITIRHLDPLEAIGIYKVPGITFRMGKPDGSYLEIDNSDLVIAEGTFLYLAVARGKSVIGINQRIPIAPNTPIPGFKIKNWDKYGDYMAYPIDFDDGPLLELIAKASKDEQKKWKELFIGKQMNSKDLSDLLSKLRIDYLKGV